jgi:hypothetical protein
MVSQQSCRDSTERLPVAKAWVPNVATVKDREDGDDIQAEKDELVLLHQATYNLDLPLGVSALAPSNALCKVRGSPHLPRAWLTLGVAFALDNNRVSAD